MVGSFFPKRICSGGPPWEVYHGEKPPLLSDCFRILLCTMIPHFSKECQGSTGINSFAALKIKANDLFQGGHPRTTQMLNSCNAVVVLNSVKGPSRSLIAWNTTPVRLLFVYHFVHLRTVFQRTLSKNKKRKKQEWKKTRKKGGEKKQIGK